jgi:hypothetical protein
MGQDKGQGKLPRQTLTTKLFAKTLRLQDSAPTNQDLS